MNQQSYEKYRVKPMQNRHSEARMAWCGKRRAGTGHGIYFPLPFRTSFSNAVQQATWGAWK
jgi:hypothetical protein